MPVITPRCLVLNVCAWFAIPILIFLFGWFKIGIAIVVSLLLLVGVWKLDRNLQRDAETDTSLLQSFSPGATYWISLVVLLLVMVFCGHGGLFAQSWDWQFRNAVMYDLYSHSWPVDYGPLEGGSPGPRLLCYYFAYFLPGAVAAKMCGTIVAGELVQLAYGFWGMAIAFSLLCSFTGRVRWWLLLMMLVFAGLDSLSSTAIALHTGVGEWWSRPFFIFDYYKSYTLIEQLAQIFNQTIACWIALPLIYAFRHRPGPMLLLSAMLFVFAPLPCVGIALPLIWYCAVGWRRLFDYGTLSALALGVVTGLFYISNSNASSPGATPTLPAAKILLLALNFAVFGICVWLPFIWKEVRRNLCFWMMVGADLLLPLLAVGDSADLGLRAAIPLMIFIFYALVATLRNKECNHRMTLGYAGAVGVMLIVSSFGAWSPIGGVVERAERTHSYGIGLDHKRYEMIGKLDNPAENPYYNNFIAMGESFYLRFLAPGPPAPDAPAPGAPAPGAPTDKPANALCP